MIHLLSVSDVLVGIATFVIISFPVRCVTQKIHNLLTIILSYYVLVVRYFCGLLRLKHSNLGFLIVLKFSRKLCGVNMTLFLNFRRAITDCEKEEEGLKLEMMPS